MSDKRSEQTQGVLQGRVAQILNERELVINIGANNGVSKGMKFAVLAEVPTEVRDPQTKEPLDQIDREKVRVEASEVRPKIAICKTYRTIKTQGSYFWGNIRINELLNSPPNERKETLRAKDSALPPPLSPEDSYVKINDRVVLVEDND